MPDYVPQSRDTSEAAERFWFARLREMEPWQKARMVTELCRGAEELALAGLRMRHPGASERELRLRLAATRFDRETMIRVFGWDPAARS